MGVLVSLIKLSSLAEEHFYTGFYLSLLFSIMLLWCCIRYRPYRVWDKIKKADIEDAKPGVRGINQSLRLCRYCGMPFHSEKEQDICPRCGSKVSKRNAMWFQKTFALLCTALILYLPSNIYPVMYTEFLFSQSGANIIEGVIAMWNMNSYFVALVILLASIFIPIFKILALCFILFSVKRKISINSMVITHIYRIVLFIGRWSMIDVFVVIIMSSVVRMSGLLTISPGFAIICFCAVVFFTIFAADEFDERFKFGIIVMPENKENTLGNTQAVVKKPRKFSLVWVIPCLACVITALLIWNNTINVGPEIKIIMSDAEGMEAGKTLVKFRSVVVGTVKDISLSDDFSKTVLTVEMKLLQVLF